MRLDEAIAALLDEGAVLRARIDDDDARAIEAEMTLDQRQRAASDGAEADHHDRAGDLPVNGKGGVGHVGLRMRRKPGWRRR